MKREKYIPLVITVLLLSSCGNQDVQTESIESENVIYVSEVWEETEITKETESTEKNEIIFEEVNISIYPTKIICLYDAPDMMHLTETVPVGSEIIVSGKTERIYRVVYNEEICYAFNDQTSFSSEPIQTVDDSSSQTESNSSHITTETIAADNMPVEERSATPPPFPEEGDPNFGDMYNACRIWYSTQDFSQPYYARTRNNEIIMLTPGVNTEFFEGSQGGVDENGRALSEEDKRYCDDIAQQLKAKTITSEEARNILRQYLTEQGYSTSIVAASNTEIIQNSLIYIDSFSPNDYSLYQYVTENSDCVPYSFELYEANISVNYIWITIY